jgi:hypothetical protein
MVMKSAGRGYFVFVTLWVACFPAEAQNGQGPCDLNQDGSVDQADVSRAVSMTLGLSTCTGTVQAAGVCNVVLVQRVANAAATGGTCLTDAVTPRTVVLTWVHSTSPNVTGYNVYRAASPTGQYTKLNASPVTGASYSDASIARGQTYYYVTTAINSSNLESDYSNVAQAAVPLQ